MPTKLNQIIAVEKGVKAEVYSQFTELHQMLQKPQLLAGIIRTYRPVNDEGDQLPPERTNVQLDAEQAIEDASALLTRLFNVVATKDWANTQAKADIKVGERTIAKDVPATYLLFLEKQLNDLMTFVKKLPIRDPAEQWHYDETAGCNVTQPSQSIKTKKTPRHYVKAEATKEHPAQVEMYYEDVIVGHWTTIKMSGALSVDRVSELVRRVETLREAVKFAREEANSVVVPEGIRIGEEVLAYLFAK